MSQTQLANLEALVPLLRDVLLSNPQLGPEARDQWMALEPALQRSLQPATTGSGVSPAAAAAAVPSGAVSPLTLPLPDPTPDEYEYERELGVESKEASEHSYPSERASDAEARWTNITLPVPTVQYLSRLASLGWASLSESSRLATLQLFARPHHPDVSNDEGLPLHHDHPASDELQLNQVSAFFTRIADRRQRRLERRRRLRAACRSVGEWTVTLGAVLVLFFFTFSSIWLAAASRGDVEKAFAGVLSSFWLGGLLFAVVRIIRKGPIRFARRTAAVDDDDDDAVGVVYNANGVTRAQEGLVSGRRSGRIQLGSSPSSRPVSV